MNKQKLITYLPHILIILANIVYMYANGFKPLSSHPKLILYNILFFLIIGAIIMIKVNLLLHSWFVKEEGDVKQKTKVAVQKAINMKDFVLSVFRKGNERMMIKIFFLLNLWIMVNQYVPGFLLGTLVGTYFQYEGFIEQKFSRELKQLDDMKQKAIARILQILPKYQSQNMKNQ